MLRRLFALVVFFISCTFANADDSPPNSILASPRLTTAEQVTAFVQVGTRESLNEVILYIAQAPRDKRLLALMNLADALTADMPLDVDALRAAMGFNPQEYEKGLLNQISIRRNQGELPWDSSPITLTKRECEETRSLPPQNQNYCFGIPHLRHEVLNACLAYQIDFDQTCIGSVLPATPAAPLIAAIRVSDEYAIVKLFERTSVLRLQAPIYELIGSARKVIPIKMCQARSVACFSPQNLPWLKRMLTLFMSHGAGVDDLGTDGAEMTPFLGMAAGPLTYSFDPTSPEYEQANQLLLQVLLDSGADVNAKAHMCNALDYTTAELNRLAAMHRPNLPQPNGFQGASTIIANLEKREEFLTAHGGKKSLSCVIQKDYEEFIREITPNIGMH